ncbi:MAG: GIY-YIG nuclease family protein [Acidobacteriia bacterium]|nr:GIY-YIG nuclease family protein [Terriglobia bacterium]
MAKRCFPRNWEFRVYFVCVLRSFKDGKYYIGSTGDVMRRLGEHNAGQQAATRYRRPFQLVYTESYVEPKRARRRERYLKAQKSRKLIDWLITGARNSEGTCS